MLSAMICATRLVVTVLSEPSRDACTDAHANCQTVAMLEGGCADVQMRKMCPLSCGVCISNDCFDAAADCKLRMSAAGDSCYTPEMIRECAWSCVACNLSTDLMCARPRSVLPAAAPGGVDSTFRAIVTEVPNAAVLSRDPWVVTIDNFLNDAEADRIIAAVDGIATPSAETAEMLSPESGVCDESSQRRSSWSTWCTKPRCRQDETVQQIGRRAEGLLRVPLENAEPLQVLRYEVGGRYVEHHDQTTPRTAPAGPRLYTLFLYLSDEMEGGETHFPVLNLTVTPKIGRALLWPSVLDTDPFARDPRTLHEALPVTRGVKIAANYWVHAFPYTMYARRACGSRASLHNWYARSDFFDPRDPLLESILDQLDAVEAGGDTALLDRLIGATERELQDRNATFGSRHPATLKCQYTLASLFGLRGRASSLRAALSLHGATLMARRRILGEAHEETLSSLSSFGRLLCQQGDVGMGTELLREALAAYHGRLGERHDNTRRVQRWLQECTF